jgi:hypothetical protein
VLILRHLSIAVLEEMNPRSFLFATLAKGDSDSHPAWEIKKSCTRVVAAS